ncbi:MAG: class I SAM-dependent methyltransferase [Rhodospirillaceae bacterium]
MSWDERFAGEDYVYGTRPNGFLAAQAEALAPGSRVLVPGDGEGRNGVWLARRGMRVHSVDSSAVGLAKARRLAGAHGVVIETECADLAAWRWPDSEFDAVVAIFLHLRPEIRAVLHVAMLKALRPGGRIILQAFRPAQLGYQSGGPREADRLFTAAMLAADFADAEVLVCEEALVSLDEGPLHQGMAATVGFVARRR